MAPKRKAPPSCHRNFLSGQLRDQVLRVKLPRKATLGAALRAMHIEVSPRDGKAKLMAFYAYDRATGTIKKHSHGHGTS